MSDSSLRELLERFVEHRETTGESLSAERLCGDRSELLEPLAEHIRLLDEIDLSLSFDSDRARPGATELPSFEGFRTIERLGAGGMGDVYKLEDLQLGRTVAAKVLRDEGLGSAYRDFLDEARAMALFQDPRIVQIFDFRPAETPPVLIMEHVEGFDLATIGPSLSFAQRASIVAEVCEAIHRAHSLGIQHRDLKPANILVDAKLRPRIVDFGLSGGDPRSGHRVGTLAYMAPEQLDEDRAIDARTDVYALGVTLYELLCGERPFAAADQDGLIGEILRAKPRLPVEIAAAVPEPLQAIALKAMELTPENRYRSARELGDELRRYLADRPVLARPTLYASALERRVRPHLEQIREWLELRLIFRHEADRLRDAYQRLEAREDDWIVQSRKLTFSQISLYLGAFLLFCGSLFYFAVHRIHEAVDASFWHPMLVLGFPFAGLTVGGRLLERDRRDQRAVAIAFYLGGALVLPVLLLIMLHEAGWWVAAEGQFFAGGEVSNRQLQVATFAAGAWTLGLALRTRTVALSSLFSGLLLLFTLALLTDLGLREWLDEGRWNVLAFHLSPLLVVATALGIAAEKRAKSWLTTPLYLGSVGLYVVLLELVALDGRAFHHLGITLAGLQPETVDDPQLLDTLGAMTINGLLVYATAIAVERRGSEIGRKAARLLLVLSPFLILEPIAYLNQTAEYSTRFDWMYLALSLAVVLISRFRQRKSFYYAGLVNIGLALVLIADRYEWFDSPGWSVGIITAAMIALAVGLGLSLQRAAPGQERTARGSRPQR